MTTIETLNNWESWLSHRNKLNNNFLALNTDKVEVVAWKGLSENDYTTAEKSKLAWIEAWAQVNVWNEYTTAEQSKLAWIEAGAEVNTLADVVAWTNITIDKTDPLNPVISATWWGGGWSGDVVWPSSSVDSAIPLYDWTTGKLLKDSAKTITTTLGWDDTTIPTSKAVSDAIGWAGGWDMTKAIYDPQTIEADAFNRTNHTGIQTMSTISDAWALATLDTVDTAQIDNDAVTLDKIQNISTNRVLARSTAWVWSVEELTLPNFRSLINVEDWADVTDTTNVATAGAVMSDNNLNDLANITTAKTNLSIENVNNTSDLNKPISTETQSALDWKVSSDTTWITGADQVTNLVSLTQAEYNAITPDIATTYLITDA